MLRLHNLLSPTKALGPYSRAAVWLQGCHRRCEGCMTPDSRPLDGGFEVSVAELAQALTAEEGIEGITVSGGEPFLQAQALARLLTQVRAAGLGVIIYTGYTLEQLRAMEDEAVHQILNELTDILIDGEYVDALNDGAPLRGSSNQRVLHLTDRYESCRWMYEGDARHTELRITDGKLTLVGIPGREVLRDWETIAAEYTGGR